MQIYAHSRSGISPYLWERLSDHLAAVARRAARNAVIFGAASLAGIAGWLHDLGKLKPDFQHKLTGAIVEVSHSGEGARAACKILGWPLGKMLAYVIAGHHSGLPNGVRTSEHRPPTPLKTRIAQSEDFALPDWITLPEPAMPPLLMGRGGPTQFTQQFFIRMLFSALVDADFIETERFYWPDAPRGYGGDLARLRKVLRQWLAAIDAPDSAVNRLRAEVLARAGVMADEPPGFFSLTVPTGGGKTLTSLHFAFEHAARHGLRRVIHVAPFTAIIEQTAEVFRTALQDPDSVLEHHSSFDLDHSLPETEAERMRLAAQNWDRPVIVTTAVQFYESLFANRTQKCRKLHHIARSVIVLDEAQNLPLLLLHPCLAALNELVTHYGCSVVLCTATQPAIYREQGLELPEAPTLAATREIAPDPVRLFATLKRTEVRHVGAMDNAALTARIAGRSALVIVNNKRHARDLFDGLRGAGVYHLTTAMTAAHRRAVLAEVRERLKPEEPMATIVVSTALIEAGVDISFPEVWRATAGLDSIAQAAGRCNREGKMVKPGQVFVFDADPAYPPPPELARNATIAREVMARHPDALLLPEAIRDYFSRLYWDSQADLDAKGIMARIDKSGNQLDFDFADIAHDFRLIEDVTCPLIVGVGPWGIGADERELMKGCKHAGVIARAVQRFTVPVRPHDLSMLVAQGDVSFWCRDDFGDQFPVLDNETLYDPEAGLSMGRAGEFDGFM